MADKYTIQIDPQISASDGQQMENDLNRRFSNISKKFGTHLKNSIGTSLKLGAAAGLAAMAGLIATNPFEKVKEDLHETLNQADDLVTRAAQFGVTTAKFAQLQAIANSVGLDIDMALQQFSGALQEAKQFNAGDTSKSNALANYVNLNGDIVDKFYHFIKAMQSLPAEQRSAEVGKLYGDKLALKIAELLQQDIETRKKAVLPRGRTQDQVGKAAEKLAEREDQAALLRVRREQEALIRKSRVITKSTINVDDAVQRAKDNREVQNLSQFEIFARQAALQEEMLAKVDQLRSHIMDAVFPLLQKMVEYLGKMINCLITVIDWLKTIAGKIRKFWS